ncbi:glycoside hydrolase family 1 protein [Candidatus Daviesbacteria bacterium]|nr:glycoside hydrolase family 1 protein [Candidatus Daviesbacteria bacterium]
MTDDPPKEKHDHATLFFPKNFLWGAAASAHQVEGNNINNDWWEWEQRTQPEDKRSLEACDQYNRFASDFELIKKLGHNSHRLSLEWSRIEPTEGQFNQEAIDHYKKVLKALKERDLIVMLTLWHFTLPLWVAKTGGWANGKTVSYFERFLKKVVPEIKDYVDLWITLNEPGGYAVDAFYKGKFPPNVKSKSKLLKAYWNLAQAHKKSYQLIHEIIPSAKVGIAQNINSFDAFHHHSIRESIAEWILDILYNHSFYFLTGKKTHDFLGINYYFNNYISFNGEHAKLPSLINVSETQKDLSDMGWEIYPEGIFDILMDFSDYHLPIYITENGLASTNDDRRCRFLIAYLKEVYHAIQSGADVRGYFHWSLIDNYEWVEGFEARFGLVEVDFKTQKRTVRPSAYVYKEIIKNNGIYHYLLRFLGHTVKADEVLYPEVSHDGRKPLIKEEIEIT